jgi:PIN domain nuclease of toxin-antitoxin system
MATPLHYVVDTHALVFFLADDPRLSADASAVFEKADRGDARIVVPIIVLAEIAWLVEKGKVPLDFDDVLATIRGHPSYSISALDELRLECLVKTTRIPEMHDRFIACEALLGNAALITSDTEIRSSGVVPVVW